MVGYRDAADPEKGAFNSTHPQLCQREGPANIRRDMDSPSESEDPHDPGPHALRRPYGSQPRSPLEVPVGVARIESPPIAPMPMSCGLARVAAEKWREI